MNWNLYCILYKFTTAVSATLPRTHAHTHTHAYLSLYSSSFKMFPESFYSEKYNILQSFKVQFLQNDPLVQLYTSASTVNVLETLLEAIL
jgi:hypothetical protein